MEFQSPNPSSSREFTSVAWWNKSHGRKGKSRLSLAESRLSLAESRLSLAESRLSLAESRLLDVYAVLMKTVAPPTCTLKLMMSWTFSLMPSSTPDGGEPRMQNTVRSASTPTEA